ncbi:hypothetical protein BCR33DRAFT_338210 [Rhizoclosmatium globosum]|uniref:Uncharacterized protein n=1 Tax=Rhizoclosmatium globosum TaxID=329046 RepID=A0A1Y2C3V5_9FUNG|nr:hypothetical protein BCR33DRAFT_338210 [Rhizoclosmatium globosum]|eukprot:ORY41709.1 hypothetical protein BCR33DRAFT_338210 [Rhizoclosmatium globosum]
MKTVELLNRNKVMELRIMELQYECGNLRMSLQLYEQMNAFVTSPLAPGAFGFGQSPLNMPLPVASFQSVPISSVAPAVNSLKQPTNMEDVNRSSSTTTQAASTVSEMDFGLAQATASPQSDDWYDVAKNEKLVPAVDLFGPVQVESQRFALKHLPSIANSKYVDELMDILIALSKCSSRKAHKKLMIRMAAVKHKLMDISNILDRQRVLEIFEEFKSKHPKHIVTVNQISCPVLAFLFVESLLSKYAHRTT